MCKMENKKDYKDPEEAYDFPYGNELLQKFLKPFLSNINTIEPGQIAWMSWLTFTASAKALLLWK